ncbi:MAG TPA: endonuclease/exonuclease/phosphatase family protein [Blastocatellia bacterium]|nr:endonuclease/exonuclease/phosphatase family protein [Blastocatellia bacterium]
MTSPRTSISRTDRLSVRCVLAFILSALFASASLLPGAAAKANDPVADPPTPFTYYRAPETLTYDELLALDGPSGPRPTLLPKVNALLTTPFISNEAYRGDVPPSFAAGGKIGPFVRVGFWNVQRGFHMDKMKLAIESPEEFLRQLKPGHSAVRRRDIVEELEALRSVDVLVLNEADLGLKRTEYRDVTREMAAALKMNYVYGVEFLEIDPLNLGTEEFKEETSNREKARLKQLVEVDRDRYLGLHGTAILSRFPIRTARLVPLKYQPYDWYSKEKKRLSIAESARRTLGKIAFMQDVPREIRHGGRMVLLAELHVPELPGETLTVVATHLEDRCKPSERRRQAKEVLSIIKGIKGPVVLAGDFNTSGLNNEPTSIRNEIMKRVKDKTFWAKRGLKFLMPLGPAFDFLLEVVSYARTMNDPTAKGVLFFAPNNEAGFFKDLEAFRFDDGYRFDFRGDASRTVNGTEGTLANSNQRGITKGFRTTRSAPRTFWSVGKNKLDWIFVKAYAKEPRGKKEPYRLAPHFPRTLEKLNNALSVRLSDHNPITVDLPINEP